jgi:predicted nucleic acid-binding protein
MVAELLQGARSIKETELIVELWKDLPKTPEQNSWFDIGMNSFKKKWMRQGIGLIDAFLINQAWDYDHKIWTLDKKLIKAAGKDFIYRSLVPTDTL